ncbi:limbin-like [Synchiropus splendidus]|uniref:limbin-like n=1 Tax=Synchiropus splendidus TaxID=270530 RepID=UPI00237E1ECA|nr:limbin-like [Synchiropus splendidus]
MLPSGGPLSSSALPGPTLSHSAGMFYVRERRTTLTRNNPGHSLPQFQSVAPPTEFGVKFYKCAKVDYSWNPPLLTFFLLIHNTGPFGGTNLSQVAVRDSISGLVPVRTDGRVVEKGYQMFRIDVLSGGSLVLLNYTAQVKSFWGEVKLPAFLTFSNRSQNDVSMFGLTAYLSLNANSTNRVEPSHGVHFAGFLCGLFLTVIMLLLFFLARNFICSGTRRTQPRECRRDSDPEYADCRVSETIKEEAMFEDKMVDIMLLEDPQNMYRALDTLEMSSLLQTTNCLEATRIQIYKDVIAVILDGVTAEDKTNLQVRQRLLGVLHEQRLGMEGRLKEERASQMAALASQCNQETREEMELEHHRQDAEKTRAELLCQHADQQDALQCRSLLEKLHKLSQNHLQRLLLVRHEEASAKVQRQTIEWRRMELHKIFSEELEEAVKKGDVEKGTAMSVQLRYFECQDQLEEVLDVVLANLRCVIAERHAQRKFLIHSLQSLNSLICDTFSSTSSHLESWFSHIRMGSSLSSEVMDHLQDRSQKELLVVRQRLEEALAQERRPMRCELIKKRRDLISDLLRVHKQRQKDLSCLLKDEKGPRKVDRLLESWQDLLRANSSELADLINSLDEEAAADIRKATMRVIQSSVAEVKAVQTSTREALLRVLPQGEQGLLHQEDQEAPSGASQGSGHNTLLQCQEKIKREGEAAFETLSRTRQTLLEALNRELQEQKDIRALFRKFFRCLCASQLTLSEEDKLRMRQEFQKCFSVMDHCLVLPHAVTKTKLLTALTSWRKDFEQKMSTRALESGHKPDTTDLLGFQENIREKIQLFEKQKEMESMVLNEIMLDMGREREEALRSQTVSLAIQMAAIVYQKAQRRARAVATSSAVLTLIRLLIHQLRERKSLDTPEVAKGIERHCWGLEETKHQKDSMALDQGANASSDKADGNSTEEQVDGLKETLFQLQPESRMMSILQDALFKCDGVLTFLSERSQQMTACEQTTEECKEEIKFQTLQAHCDQDIKLASTLVQLNQETNDVVLGVLHLLLPAVSQSQLLSVADAICPSGHPTSHQQHLGFPVAGSHQLAVALRENILQLNMLHTASCSAAMERRLRRRSLMDKLLPSSRRDEDKLDGLMEAVPLSVTQPNADQQQSDPAAEMIQTGALKLFAQDSVVDHAGERLFVFQDSLRSEDMTGSAKRKRKRNFLNWKKNLVTPELPQ